MEYKEQNIDLTDADTLLMSSKDGSRWIKNLEIYQRYPETEKGIGGIKVNLMHPRVLVEYKKELLGEHQDKDIVFLNKYIETHGL